MSDFRDSNQESWDCGPLAMPIFEVHSLVAGSKRIREILCPVLDNQQEPDGRGQDYGVAA